MKHLNPFQVVSADGSTRFCLGSGNHLTLHLMANSSFG